MSEDEDAPPPVRSESFRRQNADAMTDPYVIYDTLSFDADPNGSPEGDVGPAPSAEKKLPPILARLPKLEPAPPKPKTRQRFDAAESPHAPAFLGEINPFGETGTLASPASMPTAGFDPVATIRIDTVTPTTIDAPEKREPQRGPSEAAGPATIPFRPVADEAPSADAAPGLVADDEPWATTLLEIESTIQPYSRWIALAALLAAMGLTAVILQGGGRPAVDDSTAPATLGAPAGGAFAGNEPVEPVVEESLSWPSVEPIDSTSGGGSLSPLNEPGVAVAQTPPPTVAAGPASASRSPGHARLTGEVLEPSHPRIDVADAANRPAYPETELRR
ncbi:hypothetical protein MalM25_31150 [Planctomycetes bacterium MalM25]|nr:hypothetical protein MalM25_31150 [Planctomycetes bacterium MalM25]